MLFNFFLLVLITCEFFPSIRSSVKYNCFLRWRHLIVNFQFSCLVTGRHGNIIEGFRYYCFSLCKLGNGCVYLDNCYLPFPLTCLELHHLVGPPQNHPKSTRNKCFKIKFKLYILHTVLRTSGFSNPKPNPTLM